MSTKSTIAHGETFHLYDEVIEGGIYLELDTHDVSLHYEKYQKHPRLRVRLPKELLNRLMLDGKPLVEEQGWSNESESGEGATGQSEQKAWENNQEILSRLGGLVSGSVDSSTNCKQYVGEYLDKKFSRQDKPEE